jgi:nuclear GTP-binding protein
LRRKYTIIKKIKEHKRKVKRDLKRHPEKKRKPRTDRGVPNSCPFKEEILLDMENLKKIKEKEQADKHAEILEKRKQLREAKIAEKRDMNLEKLAKEAEQRDKLFEQNGNNSDTDANHDSLHDSSAKAYFKEFRKVIEAADVILEVLDARDPIGTRCKTVEQAVLDSGTSKRLVLVLNKAGI